MIDVITQSLIDNSVLGVMIAYFIWRELTQGRKIIKVIEQNTIAFTIFCENYLPKKRS